MENEFQNLVWVRKIFSIVPWPFEGSFLKRSGKCSGSKARFVSTVCCLQSVYGCEVTSEARSMLCRSAP